MDTASTRKRAGLGRLGSGALVALCLATAAPAARAAGASLESATPAQKKTAGEHFMAGMKAFDANKYDEALQAFRDSYRSVASPNSHLMIARTLVKLGRLGEAYEEYEKTQKEAEEDAKVDKKYAKAGKSAADERDALRSKIALLSVQVTGAGGGDQLTVGGRQIDQADWSKPVPVDPGNVDVVLESASGKTTRKQVTATAGGTPTVQIAPAAPAAATAKSETKADVSTSGIDKRTLAYIAGGVGAAGLVTFGVFGILNNSKYGDLKDACPDNSCPPGKKSEADTGRTYQTVANVGLVVGIVGLAGGTALYILSTRDDKKDSEADTADARDNRRGVDVGVGFGSVNVRGTF